MAQDDPPRVSVRRRRELGLAVGAFVLVLAVGIAAWIDLRQDEAGTLAEARASSRGQLDAIEGLWRATLRDAANAAISAASAIEDDAANQPDAGLSRLLQRALADDGGAARLVFARPDGTVLASSAEPPARVAGLRVRVAGGIPYPGPPGRTLFLGTPETSRFDGQQVLPLWCLVQGARPGLVRAELRLGTLQALFAGLLSRHQATVFVMDASRGDLLLRLPLVDRPLRVQPEVLALLTPQSEGATELLSPLDGATRIYSWRRLDGGNIVIGHGLVKASLLAPVLRRAEVRAAVAASLVLAILALAGTLLLYLRRIDRMQDRAEAYERRYWAAIEGSAIGVAIMREDGTWAHANAALCRMLGYSPQEILAVPAEMHTPPHWRAQRAAAIERLREGSLMVSAVERPMLHKDGHELWVGITSTEVPHQEGEPRRFISQVLDLSERQAALRALQALNRELESRVEERTRELRQANADLEAFSWSAAHDLKSPLGRLNSYADILREDLVRHPERVPRWLDAIGRQVASMSQLVDSLLALSRMSAEALHPQEVDMGALVEGVRAELQAGVEPGRVHWTVHPLGTAQADPSALRVALHNLLGNAIKYSARAQPPAIEVGCFDAQEPGRRGFYVKDNGVGFDITLGGGGFAPFRRFHSAGDFPGSGIGLAIVERVLRRHGGSLRAESAPGQGATFFFTLPAVATAPGMPA